MSLGEFADLRGSWLARYRFQFRIVGMGTMGTEDLGMTKSDYVGHDSHLQTHRLIPLPPLVFREGISDRLCVMVM